MGINTDKSCAFFGPLPPASTTNYTNFTNYLDLKVGLESPGFSLIKSHQG